MLPALALYPSTAHAKTAHGYLDLLYHDGGVKRLDKRLVMGVSSSPGHTWPMRRR
jgi:hypothetical protein